jgi:probable addiction module antidote protein
MRTERLNAADYLGSGNAKVEYITAAYETGDPEFIRDAYNLAARARGMTRIAAETGLSRESRTRRLASGAIPNSAQ